QMARASAPAADTTGAVATARGAVTGVVVDSVTRVAVAGAQVMLRATALGAQTDVLGRYRIAGVPAGDYELLVRRIGYAAATRPIRVAGDSYFEHLAGSGLATLGLCQHGGDPDGPWLSACLFLDGGNIREYHLAATSPQGRSAGASAFALHQAALAARAAGRRRLYLGGGSDVRPNNPLLFFKSAYSDQRLCYRTGSTVFDSNAYDRLKLRFPAAWAAHPERPIFYRKV
ncbi:MAG: carboxypeptidase-like regulatory domain-containing protein, partial [Pseudomonadota bacterium]|nr:carboxypeptidase-like regulatory domain-containing protein [Pseudomonadota bacterium]